jgi:hypothetical protein
MYKYTTNNYNNYFFLSTVGRAASRAFGALASGYPLHHLRTRRFAPSAQVVPLLSLSLRHFVPPLPIKPLPFGASKHIYFKINNLIPPARLTKQCFLMRKT